MHPFVHGSTVYNSQAMEMTWMSMNRWMHKEAVVCIYIRILLSHKKDAICSNMDGPRSYHAKRKERKKVQLLSHVWLFVTPWTVACQAPLSTEFSREEYWNALPFPSPDTKWSKSEGEKQIPHDIIYMWNLNHDINELIQETETDSQT